MLVEVVVVDGLPGQQVRDREPRPEVQRGGDLAELQVQIDQAHALARLGGEVARQVGGVERLAAAPAGRGHGEHLGELGTIDHHALSHDGRGRGGARLRDVGDVEGPLQRVGELALARRVLDQLHRAGPDDVAQAHLGLGAEGQDHRRDGGSGAQAGEARHAGMAVEHGARDEDVEGTLLAHLVGDVDDVGARDDLVPRAERGLNGPAQGGRTADNQDPTGDHGTTDVWLVPMHTPTGGGLVSFWV